MYNFDSYNVLLAIATNIPVLLMTAFVLQGHIFFFYNVEKNVNLLLMPFNSASKESFISGNAIKYRATIVYLHIL